MDGFQGSQEELVKAVKEKSHKNITLVLQHIFTRLIDAEAGAWVASWIEATPPSFLVPV